MEEVLRKKLALKEEIARLEDENKKLLLQFQKAEKLDVSIERTVHIAKSFGCAIFASLVAVPIIPEGRFIALIAASLLVIPAVLVSYIFH